MEIEDYHRKKKNDKKKEKQKRFGKFNSKHIRNKTSTLIQQNKK